MKLTVSSISEVTQSQTFQANSPMDSKLLHAAPQSRMYPAHIALGDGRTTKNSAQADAPLDRQKRGQVLGACAKSKFRECKGGDALEEHSSRHEKFDQFDHDRTKGGKDGKGTCDGIVREAMRRIDHATDGAAEPDTLPSAVHNMNNAMASNTAGNPGEIYDRIDQFQTGQTPLPLANYRLSSSVDINPTHDATRNDRINSLIGSMSADNNMPEGGLAYIRMGIQAGDAMNGPERYGHVLLAQHLPNNHYAIFDPNNGVFTYDNKEKMINALKGYMQTAYNEGGQAVAPDSIRFYTPHNARDFGSAQVVTKFPGLGNGLPEPGGLLNHFGLPNPEL
ncbi:hypothetical protein NE850_17240 [Paraburkholderia sp. USG1]|uniref:hypothetical protein n=1 Tax=Paraburkholderia sp. USG1 TaxID=2952268 RepID=UPI00285F33D5|nr:hypothetical protein [Paraburkholderia sp. USG1]MDR8398092.1 hypothetical protein [Paraburkholderia sp. USG1]